MSEPFEHLDEIVVAHPCRVAQADQVQAAEPRLKRSAVLLHDWVGDDAIYVVNLAAMRDQLRASLDAMRFDV